VNPLVDAALALALQSSAVEASRIEAPEHTPVERVIEAMRAELTPHFQEAWDDPRKRQAHLTGKRMGKSEYGGRRLFRGAALNPKSVNPYIGPTAKAARLRMWPLIKRIAEAHFPTAKVNESMMTVTLDTGGVVVVGGCDHINKIGDWYGMPFAEALVDECGTFGPYLPDLIEDGLKPSMMDFDGFLTLAGNPGLVPLGYWYGLTGPSRTATIPLYIGDARDNPHVKAAAFFASTLEENGWTEDHPTFLRMYLGKWAWDPSAFCFPYKAERNSIPWLPERSLAGGILNRWQWRFVIASDVAGLGITSIVVIAVHPGDPRDFSWSSEVHSAWLPEQLVTRVETIKADTSHKFDMSKAVLIVDTGGLGSVHNVHLTRKAGHLFHESADKADKKSWVRTLHDDTLSGRHQWVEGQNQPAIDEMAVLEWDEKHQLWEEGPSDHVMDATGYGKRRAHHYTRDAVGEEKAETPEQRNTRLASELKAKRMREMQKQQRSAWR